MRPMAVTAVILVLIIAGWSRLGFPQVRTTNADSWPATNDLILHLPFDPDIKPVIAWSHGKTQPVPALEATLVDGILGKAASFDGKRPGIVLPAFGDFGLKAFTFEVWMRPAKGGRGSLFLNMGDTDQGGIRIEKRYSAISFRLGNGTMQYVCTSPEFLVETGSWYHVATTYDGQMMRVFLNGKDIASAAGPQVVASTGSPLYIGVYFSNPTAYRYVGLLDEMALFSRAKSDDEIFEDMAASLRPRPE